MASGGSISEPEHGKTKVIKKYTAADCGPLTYYSAHPSDEHKYYDDFSGASYFVTTPNAGGLVLYRRYGGTAKEEGHYWSVDRPDGKLSHSILPQWDNTLEKETILRVPPGILLFEGFVAPQHPHAAYGRRDYGYLGGGWQVLIPTAVVRPLLHAQKASVAGKRDEEVKYMREAMSAQSSLMERVEQKVKEEDETKVREFCSIKNAQQLLSSGNAVLNLAAPIREMLTSQGLSVTSRSSSSRDVMPQGSYLLHRETIRLVSGANIPVSLYVRIEFSHETSRTYTSGRTVTTEVTRNYKRIFEWK